MSYTKTNLPTITSTQAKLLSEKTTPENSRSGCFKRHCSILNMKRHYFLSPLKLQNDCLSCVNQSSTKPFQAVHAAGCFCDKNLTTLSSHDTFAGKFRFENSPHFECLCAGAGWGVGVGERGLCRNVGSYKKRWRSVVLPYHAFLRLTVDALSGDRNGAGAGGANRECICLELQPYNTHDAVKSINTPSTVDSLCACRHRAPATRYCTAPPG